MSDRFSRTSLFTTLAIPSFRTLWIAQLLSQIAVNMLTFVLGVMIYEHTRSNAAVSLLYFTVGIPAAVFGVLSGVFVDRFNKRQVLLITTLVRVGLVLLIYFLRGHLLTVYLLTAVVSAVSQFFVPAEASLIPRFVPANLLLPANSLFTLTFYSAIIGGFVAGGPLIEALGNGNVLLLLALIFFVAAGFLFFLPQTAEITPPQLTFEQVGNDLLAGLRYIISIPTVKYAIGILTMSQAVISVFLTLGPGFADSILAIKVTDASLVILGPAAIGMIVGAIATGALGGRMRRRRLIELGIYLAGGLLLVVGLLVRTRRYTSFVGLFEQIFSVSLDSAILPVAIFCFFLLGLAMSLIDVTCNTVLQESTTDEVRGRVYGVLSSVISGVSLLPVIISGILADLLGVGKIIFIMGILITAAGVGIGGGWKRLKQVFVPTSRS